MEERGCWKCGVKTGGDLRRHKDDCSYVLEMSDKHASVREYLAGKNADTSWTQKKGPKKNSKHSLPSAE